MKPEEVRLITKGNQYADSFLGAYVTFCHLVDDLVDTDKGTVDDQRLVKEFLLFLEAVIVNPWFNENKVVLWPLVVCGANAWLDSNRMKPGEARDVVKGIYHEVVWFTAYLCGGQQHMQDITSRFREYDIEGKD